ncbi:MAG: hypothetical protein U0R68_08225 [Candidatus Nanopelagicales bacterium]
MTKARVYDLLLGAFVLAVLWPWLARGFVRPLSDHVSDFGYVGMATLLLVRPVGSDCGPRPDGSSSPPRWSPPSRSGSS